MQLHAVVRRVVPAQNHAGKVHQFFIIERIRIGLQVRRCGAPHEQGRPALLVNALGSQRPMAGGLGVLTVMVAHPVAEGQPLYAAKDLPVGHQIFVIGKAVVQQLRRQQGSGKQLVAQAEIHPMVVEQRFQMGWMAQRPRVSGGLPGRRRAGKGVIPAAGHRQAGGFRRR